MSKYYLRDPQIAIYEKFAELFYQIIYGQQFKLSRIIPRHFQILTAL